jgi:hypothetical protein
MAALTSTMFTTRAEVLPEHEQIGSSLDMRLVLNAALMAAPSYSAAFDPAHGFDGST